VEHHDLIDDLDRRLRAARPAGADVEADAFDADLLARVRRGPVAGRSAARRRVALPAAAGVAVAATAAVMFIGGPGDVGGPSSADAITQTMHWLDPPAGTVLHTKSVETSAGQTVTREFWQSVDDPEQQRAVSRGAESLETAGDAFYDPATNTIYDPTGPATDAKAASAAGAAKGSDSGAADAEAADAKKAAALEADGKAPEAVADQATADGRKPVGDERAAEKRSAVAAESAGKSNEPLPVGDPIVLKAGNLLEGGQMMVSGRELHDGVEAWAITLRPGQGRPAWTLWVSAADGKPLELRDPGRGGEAGQVIRWSTYELLPADSAASGQLTLSGAHPTATVVTDPVQVEAARARLWPPKG
jgi:hypothetical protein